MNHQEKKMNKTTLFNIFNIFLVKEILKKILKEY